MITALRLTVPVHEINAKTIFRKSKRVDSWFLAFGGMNLYRGCMHNCTYCDGRAEQYRVQGEFGSDVDVKVNAPDILKRELDPARRRKPFPGGFVLLGGGVGDVYQAVESRYCLARRVLEIVRDFGHAVHVLTKSALLERDFDILSDINQGKKAIISMSFSTVDEALSEKLEPGVPSPGRRLEVLRGAKAKGMATGMYLMPLIPFLTDTPEQIDRSFRAAQDAGVDFVVAAGLTLKPGRQREYFFKLLRDFAPEKLHDYHIIYRDNPYGGPEGDYQATLGQLVRAVAQHYGMALRMPREHFERYVTRAELVSILLEHIDYFSRIRGRTSPFGFAAHQIAQKGYSPEELALLLGSINGVGPVVKKQAREILETGTCRMYERLRK